MSAIQSEAEGTSVATMLGAIRSDGIEKAGGGGKPKRGRAAPPEATSIPDLTSDDRGVSVTTLQAERVYAVQFDFNRDLVGKMRRVEGAEFSKEEGAWLVPAAQVEPLKSALEAMRVEVLAGEKARDEIEVIAIDIAAGIHRANGVPKGTKAMINDFHGAGDSTAGEIVAANSRFVAQYTGAGSKDGAAFIKLHRLSDLNEQVFAGDHAAIRYGDNGRGDVSRYEPQAKKFQRLEESMGRYVDGVKVTQVDDKFVVQFDYNPVLASRIGPILGAEFDKEKKVWTIGAEQGDVVARAVYDMRKEVVADRGEREDLTALANDKMDCAKVSNAYAKDGQAYTGEVLARTSRYVLQHTGKEFMALHRVDGLSQAPEVGQKVRIEYQGGKGRVADRGQTRGADGRGHDR